jgi:hypothetical protein
VNYSGNASVNATVSALNYSGNASVNATVSALNYSGNASENATLALLRFSEIQTNLKTEDEHKSYSQAPGIQLQDYKSPQNWYHQDEAPEERRSGYSTPRYTRSTYAYVNHAPAYVYHPYGYIAPVVYHPLGYNYYYG